MVDMWLISPSLLLNSSNGALKENNSKGRLFFSFCETGSNAIAFLLLSCQNDAFREKKIIEEYLILQFT